MKFLILLFTLCFSVHFINSADLELIDLKEQIELTQEQKLFHEQFIKSVSYGYYEQVKALLPMIGDINYQDENGNTALIWSVFKGYENIVSLLLKAGSNIDIVNKNGRTALIWAAWNGNEKIVELLLNEGANPNLISKAGNDALDCATKNNHVKIIESLNKYIGTYADFQQLNRGIQNKIYASHNGKLTNELCCLIRQYAMPSYKEFVAMKVAEEQAK